MWGHDLSAVDATNAWELTRAEVELRKACVAQWLDRRANWPGWQRSYVGFMPPHLGVRETRRLGGEHVVSEAEMGTATCPDSVGMIQYDLQLPYRCLVPRELGGQLVAGPCVSVQTAAHHRIRIAPSCALLDEAAGLAAAPSLQAGVEPRWLPFDMLRRQLEKQGVCFGPLGELPKRLQA